MTLRRMWVNQPSTLQPDHEYHGQNVLVMEQDRQLVLENGSAEIIQAWFTSGPVWSSQMFVLSLSDGWK